MDRALKALHMGNKPDDGWYSDVMPLLHTNRVFFFPFSMLILKAAVDTADNGTF